MLTNEQKQVVEFKKGHQIVCAAAGSGKTRCIATRAGLLADRAKVLTLAYNTEAAQEIRDRATLANHYAHTFHAFALAELNKSRRVQVADEWRTVIPAISRAIINTGFRAKEISEVDPMNRPKYIRSLAINALSQWSYQAEMLLPYTETELKEVSQSYYQGFPFFQLLAAYGRVADLPVVANTFAGWHIQIDEAQDCTPLRWKIINAIATKAESLTIVGDPRQSIYKFQGADPKLFLNRWHSGTFEQRSISLNFRCARRVVNYANQIVEGTEYDIGETQKAARNFDGVVKEVSASLPGIVTLCRTNKIADDTYLGRTMHSVKGLEFDSVIVNKQGWPCGEDEEEEDRLMYVACTRAKDNLYILEK